MIYKISNICKSSNMIFTEHHSILEDSMNLDQAKIIATVVSTTCCECTECINERVLLLNKNIPEFKWEAKEISEEPGFSRIFVSVK